MKAHALILFVSVLIASSVFAQKTAPEADKTFTDLIGVWTIQRVMNGSKEITSKDAPRVQTIEFNREGRYFTLKGKNAPDSGSYRVNENHQILYLQSDLSKDNVMQWQMVFKGNTLTLTGRDDPQRETLRYIYNRTAQKPRR